MYCWLLLQIYPCYFCAPGSQMTWNNKLVTSISNSIVTLGWTFTLDKIKPIYFLSVGLCRFESLKGVQRHLLKHSHVSNTRSRLPTSPSQDENRDKQLKQSGAHFNPVCQNKLLIEATNKSESRPDMEERRVYKKVTSAGVIRTNRAAQGASCSRTSFKQADGSTGNISEQTTPKDGHTSHCRGRMAASHSADMHTFTGH